MRNRKPQSASIGEKAGVEAAKVSAGALAGAALAIDPTGTSTVAAGAGLLAERVAFAWRSREGRRAGAFARAILWGVDEASCRAYAERAAETDLFEDIWTAALLDEEEEKVPVYAAVVKAFLDNICPMHHRATLLRSVRALPLASLLLLQKVYSLRMRLGDEFPPDIEGTLALESGTESFESYVAARTNALISGNPLDAPFETADARERLPDRMLASTLRRFVEIREEAQRLLSPTDVAGRRLVFLLEREGLAARVQAAEILPGTPPRPEWQEAMGLDFREPVRGDILPGLVMDEGAKVAPTRMAYVVAHCIRSAFHELVAKPEESP